MKNKIQVIVFSETKMREDVYQARKNIQERELSRHLAQLAEHFDPELCLSFHAGHNRAFIGADPVGSAVFRLVWADRQSAFSAV